MTRPGDAVPVVVFRLHDPTPIYHERCPGRVLGADRSITDDGWHVNQYETMCGRVTYHIEWRDTPGVHGPSEVRNEHEHGTWIRRDHARLIGRPCRACYPQDPDPPPPT